MPSSTDPEREYLETSVLQAVQRYVRSRVRDDHRAEDIVQDTMARVVNAQSRLSQETLEAYAIVCAKSRIVDNQRYAERHDRLMPKMFTREDHEDAATSTLAAEERQAMKAALQQLHEGERQVLVDHHVDQVELDLLAQEHNVSSGSVAVRLARARAKLRVEYLVAYRRIELPTNKCKSVLMAISAGDRRRQSALLAGDHVIDCRVCAELAPPLLERSRGLTVVAPFGLLGVGMEKAIAAAKAHPIVTSAGAVGTAGAAAAVVAVSSSSPPPPPPPPSACAGVIDIAGQPADQASTVRAGSQVSVHNANVIAVPANEGFWLGCGDFRLWVQMQTTGESLSGISPGQRASFDATIVSHQAGFASSVGVDDSEGASSLDAQGMHAQVPAASIKTI